MEPVVTGLRLLAVVVLSISGAGSAHSKTRQVTFIPVGDSYTIGEGAEANQSWPSALAKLLKAEDQVEVNILANPAKTGFTTKDALDKELPIVRKLRPQFASLMIGVNDWVQSVSPKLFRQRLGMLMDEISLVLPRKNNLIVITIPDFSGVPTGSMYSAGRDIAKGLQEFNVIITAEANQRGLEVYDIFELSRQLNRDSANIAQDQLHPSARAYQKWAEAFLPTFRRLFRGQ
jgi:lysophospholipase L1-like esterase